MLKLEFSMFKITRALLFSVVTGFVLSLAACSIQRASNNNADTNPSAQQREAPKPDNHQEAQDNGRKLGEKARETEIRTRDDRAKLKENARKAGKEIKKGTEELAAKASAAAEGIRQGWNERNSTASGNAVDINHAPASELISLGLSRTESQNIIARRPYKTKRDLVTSDVISEAAYRGVEDRITVK